MNRGTCVCGRLGYVKCTVHGDPVKGVGVTDEEFIDLLKRNKNAVLDIFEDVVDKAEGVLKRGPGRPRKGVST